MSWCGKRRWWFSNCQRLLRRLRQNIPLHPNRGICGISGTTKSFPELTRCPLITPPISPQFQPCYSFRRYYLTPFFYSEVQNKNKGIPVRGVRDGVRRKKNTSRDRGNWRNDGVRERSLFLKFVLKSLQSTTASKISKEQIYIQAHLPISRSEGAGRIESIGGPPYLPSRYHSWCWITAAYTL